MVKRYSIKEQDVINELEFDLYPGSIVLSLLKDAGAPVLGNFYLKPDLENYQWSSWEDKLNRTLEFKVVRRNNGSSIEVAQK